MTELASARNVIPTPAARGYSQSAAAASHPVPAPTSFCAPRTCSRHGMPKPVKALPSQRPLQRSIPTPPPTASSRNQRTGRRRAGRRPHGYPISGPGQTSVRVSGPKTHNPIVGEGTRKEQTQRHPTVLDELGAPLSCSKRAWACAMAQDGTVVPRSGRRGRRFKSCHPDHTCAGHSPAEASVAPAKLGPKEQKGTLREHESTASRLLLGDC